MKIIFCAMMFENVEEDIRKSVSPNPVSGHIFQENLLKGFAANGCDLSVINVPRIRRYPDYPQIFFKKKQIRWNDQVDMVHIGFLNLFGVNRITQTMQVYRELKRQVKAAKGEPVVVFTFNSYLQTTKAMLAVRKKFSNVHVCNVIGDLHSSFGIATSQRGLRGKGISNIEQKQDELAKQFDSFVFLTKYMAEALKVTDKPYVVMEGLYPPKEEKENTAATREKTVFYAGNTCKEYGMEHLLRAFTAIADPDFRLRIAGKGGDEDLIREYEKKDPRITFLGFITPEEVQKNQREATVLINARTPDREYVKYSFASKTLECLASGKPYIAHRLPCDPLEYEDYILYAADESDEALQDKIVEICCLPAEEREAIGKKCREFILKEKNPQKMCQRVLAMWNAQVSLENRKGAQV